MAWLTAFALLNGPGFAVDDTSKFKIDANTYRLTSDIGYELWISAVFLGSLVVWAASSAAFRTRIPVFVYWAWILVAAVLLTWHGKADRE